MGEVKAEETKAESEDKKLTAKAISKIAQIMMIVAISPSTFCCCVVSFC